MLLCDSRAEAIVGVEDENVEARHTYIERESKAGCGDTQPQELAHRSRIAVVNLADHESLAMIPETKHEVEEYG